MRWETKKVMVGREYVIRIPFSHEFVDMDERGADVRAVELSVTGNGKLSRP